MFYELLVLNGGLHRRLRARKPRPAAYGYVLENGHLYVRRREVSATRRDVAEYLPCLEAALSTG